MGEILKATCSICNFNRKANYGGGRMDFKTYNPVPALHKVTKKFESVNYKDKEAHKDFVFYSDNALKSSDYNGRTYGNFDLKINKEGNYCPNCSNYSLSFMSIAMYD